MLPWNECNTVPGRMQGVDGCPIIRLGVPTVAERVGLLEHKLEELENLVRGGGDVPYAKSVVGRLYDVRQTLLAAEKLSEAVREVRRDRARRWTRREKWALFLFAGLTAIGSFVAAVAAVAAALGG